MSDLELCYMPAAEALRLFKTRKLFMKNYAGEHTSPMNEGIIKAGGIVYGRTATPEFSCAGSGQ